MTPDRFRQCLQALHWSQRALASILCRDERQVRRWATGEYEIPAPVGEWLERAARWHETNPPPLY